MTVADVEARIEEIREVWYHPEKAHSLQDAMIRDVLLAILHGECAEPVLLACAAAKVYEIGF